MAVQIGVESRKGILIRVAIAVTKCHGQKQFEEKRVYLTLFCGNSSLLREITAGTQADQENRGMKWNKAMEKHCRLVCSSWLLNLPSTEATQDHLSSLGIILVGWVFPYESSSRRSLQACLWAHLVGAFSQLWFFSNDSACVKLTTNHDRKWREIADSKLILSVKPTELPGVSDVGRDRNESLVFWCEWMEGRIWTPPLAEVRNSEGETNTDFNIKSSDQDIVKLRGVLASFWN